MIYTVRFYKTWILKYMLATASTMNRFSSSFIFFLFAILFAGCSTLEEDKTKNWTDAELYFAAKSDLDAKFYDRALLLYDKLLVRYPFGEYSKQGEIDKAFVYWKKGDSVNAISTCDRFIADHPEHPSVDYVYYLKALANFDDNPGLFKSAIYGEDLDSTDPVRIREAFFTLKALVERFPDSKYSEDSRMRMGYLANILAKQELNVALYYSRIGAHVAVVNRAKFLLVEYPDSIYTKDALVLLSESYRILGMTDLQDDIDRIVAENFSSEMVNEQSDSSVWFSFLKRDRESNEVQSGSPWWKFWDRDTFDEDH